MNILELAILKKMVGGGGGSGTDNYNDLSNLPKINDTTLSGNKTAASLGLQNEINSDNKLSSDLVDDTGATNLFVTEEEKLEWSGKQDEITNANKLDADLVDDEESTNKFVTAQEKETWNAKQNEIDSSHKLSSDLVDDTNHTNKFVTSQEKETWNGKQNAIDSDHKLSSSLVSFTTAEAAALASGIDSSKVGQISTNQTNILYALETGANNLLDLSNATMVADSSLTVTKDGNSYVVSGNPSTSVQVTFTDFVPCVPITGGKIAVVGCPSGGSTSNGYSLRGYLDNSWRCSDFGSDTKEFTTSSINKIVLYFVGGHQYTNVRFTPMVVSEEVWSTLGSDYRPPALPNYDLTRLEAEDRAALAEVVDSGAKNLLDTSTTTVSNVTFTQDSNSYITASPNNADTRSWNYANTQYKLNLKAGTYIFAMDIKTATSNSGIGFNLCSSNGTTVIHSEISEILNKTGMITWQFTITAEGTYGVIYKCFDMVARLMICTKAAFGVSQKFVPYRLPYDDVQSKTTLLMNNMGGLTFNGNDLNTLVAGGRYLVNNATDNPISNAPYNSWQTVEVFQSDYSTYPKVYYQIATDVTGATVTSKWRRRVYNSGGQYNAWTAWSS